MKKKIKVVCIANPKANLILKEAKRTNNFASCEAVYLHGDLETDESYDCCEVINANSIPDLISISHFISHCHSESGGTSIVDNETFEGYRKNNFHAEKCLFCEGVFDVAVSGNRKPCVGYLWKTEEYPIILQNKDTNETIGLNYFSIRGFICYKSDEKALEYIQKRYSQRNL